MSLNIVLPDPRMLKLDKITAASGTIIIHARSLQTNVTCPRCHEVARRLHSRYERTVKDLPWQGVKVELQLTVRRFFCDRADCVQQIFVERLATVVDRYGRCTPRLNELICELGVVGGGNPGRRIAAKLQIPVSRHTVLRRVLGSQLPVTVPPITIGVDDFAFRKGQTYGTIIVDHEQGRVIDLLPDRTTETLQAWLAAHPSIAIVTRDRAQAYASAIDQGAPQAVQIADRFHLLKNVTDLVIRVCERSSQAFKLAAESVRQQQIQEWLEKSSETKSGNTSELNQSDRAGSEQRRQQRLDRFHQVRDLYRRGASIKRIATVLGMHRRDVRLYILADEFPERGKSRPRPSKLDAFLPYLQKRWDEGCHRASVLFREIRRQGFMGCESHVRHVIGQWKKSLPPECQAGNRMSFKLAHSLFQPPSARKTVWWLINPKLERTENEQQFLEELQRFCPAISQTLTHALKFIEMVKGQTDDSLQTWLATAIGSSISEVRNFALGIKQDFDAILATLTSSFSNGRVEGNVNKLKLVKRSMFGRAKFKLLKARMVLA